MQTTVPRSGTDRATAGTGAPPHGLAPATLMAAGLGWVGGTYAWPGPQQAAQTVITVVHAVPVALVVLAVAAIVTGQRAGAGRVVLTGVACAIKAMTVFAIVWSVTHPGGFGPRGLLDWVPLGMANAGGGLWLMTAIRTRARSVRPDSEGNPA